MVRDGGCSVFASRRQTGEHQSEQIKLFFDNRSASRGYMKIFIAFLMLISGACAFAGADGMHQSKLTSPADKPEKAGTDIISYPEINVNQVVAVFLGSVDRGELSIFDKPITRSMLKPVRVEYVYSLDQHLPKVSVFSEITVPISFPDMPDVFVKGVTGVLDWKGHITESIVHCQ